MSFDVRIESPTAAVVDTLVTVVRGWVTGETRPTSITVELGSRSIPAKLVDRFDVQRIFPNRNGIGFQVKLDFRSALPELSEPIYLEVDGQRVEVAKFDRDRIVEKSHDWTTCKLSKLRRINDILACPGCRANLTPPFEGRENACPKCGQVFYWNHSHFDMLPQELRNEYKLTDTDNVSAHPYPNEARRLFKDVSASGGLILDMGAGDQTFMDPDIICSEIVPYPATDVLAAGQRLPFQDSVFDAVYSNAVLEHVTDPFTCAEELMRVLRPGGRIFCSVPFLQPEHGYPHHYYNMTQDGLLNLFSRLGARLQECSVPDWGHPMYTGQWFLSSYLQYLPSEQRVTMEEMKISDFLRLRRSMDEPIFATLSDEGRRVLACTTYAIFSK